MDSVTKLAPAHATGRKPEIAAQPTKQVDFDPGKARIAKAMQAPPGLTGMFLALPFNAPPAIAEQVLPPALQGYAAAKSVLSDPDS